MVIHRYPHMLGRPSTAPNLDALQTRASIFHSNQDSPHGKLGTQIASGTQLLCGCQAHHHSWTLSHTSHIWKFPLVPPGKGVKETYLHHSCGKVWFFHFPWLEKPQEKSQKMTFTPSQQVKQSCVLFLCESSNLFHFWKHSHIGQIEKWHIDWLPCQVHFFSFRGFELLPQELLSAQCRVHCKLWRPNLQLMQVAPSGGQICNQCK